MIDVQKHQQDIFIFLRILSDSCKAVFKRFPVWQTGHPVFLHQPLIRLHFCTVADIFRHVYNCILNDQDQENKDSDSIDGSIIGNIQQPVQNQCHDPADSENRICDHDRKDLPFRLFSVFFPQKCDRDQYPCQQKNMRYKKHLCKPENPQIIQESLKQSIDIK